MDANKTRDKAVALQFDPADPQIPSLLAAGAGSLARRIVELALEHGVKVREDADLAEILSALDLGETVPAVAFAVIAEILTHVYRWETDHRETVEAGWEAAAS